MAVFLFQVENVFCTVMVMDENKTYSSFYILILKQVPALTEMFTVFGIKYPSAKFVKSMQAKSNLYPAVIFQ